MKQISVSKNTFRRFLDWFYLEYGEVEHMYSVVEDSYYFVYREDVICTHSNFAIDDIVGNKYRYTLNEKYYSEYRKKKHPILEVMKRL